MKDKEQDVQRCFATSAVTSEGPAGDPEARAGAVRARLDRSGRALGGCQGFRMRTDKGRMPGRPNRCRSGDVDRPEGSEWDGAYQATRRPGHWHHGGPGGTAARYSCALRAVARDGTLGGPGDRAHYLAIYGGKLKTYRATGECVMQRVLPVLPGRGPLADPRNITL